MPAPRHPYIVGVDLGGSRMLAGIFDSTLRLLDTTKRTTKRERGPAGVVERIARCVQDVVDEADATMEQVIAVGVGVPGRVHPLPSPVVSSEVLGWTAFPLAEALRQRLGVPAVVENDHNLATLGIHHLELRVKPRRLLGLFVGARIGGAWLVDGRLCDGFESAGGVAHMMLDPGGPACRCGTRGCFESLAGRKAVLDRIEEAIREGRRTVLADALDSLGRLRKKDLQRAVRAGDPLACEVIQSAARWLRRAVEMLVRSLEPDMVVLGGGMADLVRDYLPDALFDSATAPPIAPTIHGVPIVVSSLGDEACISGAAWLARP